VIRAAVEHLCVQVGSGMVDESTEKVFDKFGLQIAYEADFDAVLIYESRASAEIDRDDSQRFIHGKHEISGAVDAFAIAKGLGEQLADHNAGVFDGVVLIDIEIAFGGELEVEAAVFGEELQHVIEEADACSDFLAAAAFNSQFAADLSFLCVAPEFGGTGVERSLDAARTSACATILSGQGRPPGS